MQKDFEKWLFIMMQEKGASSSNQRERNVENSPKRGNIQHTQPRRQNFIGNVSGKSSYTNNRYKSTNPGTSFHVRDFIELICFRMIVEWRRKALSAKLLLIILRLERRWKSFIKQGSR